METIQFKATMDNISKILNEMGIEQTSDWESYGDGIACSAKKEDKEKEEHEGFLNFLKEADMAREEQEKRDHLSGRNKNPGLMTFEQALVKLKEGHFVARMYKDDEECELALLGVDAKLTVIYETEIVPCLLTSESLLATDWYVSR